MSSTTHEQRRHASRPVPVASAEPREHAAGWLWRSAFPLALLGCGLLFVAFPPVGLWPLAWVAPLPWLLLVRLPRLPGQRPYLLIWTAAFLYWLAMLQGIRLAHPALYAGWLALAWYVAFYLPLFVALARVAVHSLRIPLALAAPVVWVGLELVRSHLLSGFPVALLSHTQVHWLALLQISDLAGAYAVSGVMLLVSACIAEMLPIPARSAGEGQDRRATLQPLFPRWRFGLVIVVVLAATLGYGYYRLNQTIPGASGASIRVALIQGSLDTVFDTTEAEYQARVDRTLSHYGDLTRQARAENPQLDLVVWPESMFAVPELLTPDPLAAPEGSGMTAEQFGERVAESQRPFQNLVRAVTTALNPPPAAEAATRRPTYFLFGSTTFAYVAGRQRTHNSALLAAPDGNIAGRYYKMHPVMFGEYIPLADRIPWLYTLTPLSGGLTPGEGPEAFEIGGLRLAPSVCFESTVPHLIRRQVTRLAREGRPADVLVNVTNDGWFKGSSILDLHFRCAVFRAIENRKPVIIAANTGISAAIDGNGRILQQGPRRAPQVLVAEVHADGRTAAYHWLGDFLAMACGFSCLGLALVGLQQRWRKSAVEARK